MDAKSIKTAHDRQVPEELMGKLHAARERFHLARTELDASLGAAGYSHQKSVDTATGNLQAAEKEVEEIERLIHEKVSVLPEKKISSAGAVEETGQA